MSQTYNVVFTGEILDGYDLESVQRAFADIFKLNQEKVKNYFNGKPKILKKDVDRQVAAKYKSRIESVGGKVKIQPLAMAKTLQQNTSAVVELPVKKEITSKVEQSQVINKQNAETNTQKNTKSNTNITDTAPQKSSVKKQGNVGYRDDSVNLIEQGRLNQIRKMQSIEIADEKHNKLIMLLGVVFILLGLVDFALEFLQIFSLTGTFILSISSILVGLVFIKSSRAV